MPAEPPGLSSAEAARRLPELGPNSVPQEKRRPLRARALKFWAPVPWMLEAAVALEIALGKIDEAAVIAALLVLNALLAFAQEGRADRALALLRGRLSALARVLRDGRWQVISAGDAHRQIAARGSGGRRRGLCRVDLAPRRASRSWPCSH
jgi:H+-transporting ATPase